MKRLNDVSIFSFQVFVLVYESLNSMTVAQALNVPASKVSRILNQLRHALDDPLFHRKQYGFEPSEMAVRIYPEMKRVLELAEQACSLDLDEHSRIKREVCIAAPSGLRVGLSLYLNKLAEQHNQSCTFVVKPTNYYVERDIRQGEIDLSISNEASVADGVNSRFITQSNSVFVVGCQHHPIWQVDEDNMLEEIIRFPFVVNGIPAFNDRIDPLEVYARDLGRELKIEARVCDIAELANQLLDTQSLSFVGGLPAVTLLQRIEGIRVQRLPPGQMELLHGRMGAPNHFLLSSSRQHSYPEWLIDAIFDYVSDSVVLPD
ncbi:LysR family transcriptional regulator [Ferrimonas sp. YFM]|nr:LysR family transcriptional regulator [Ferrimonas sp. YFM]